ncbi:MAG: ABC transporter ATP-binding protein [Peptoniphilaceae bacterium]|nr:ABC transporter ATP-binding protein [Peptoniphilaceae bacterium]MDY6085774.1 ABC transporter ATP-binding protein [Peptoniphilaceae bacterium]
MENALIQVRDLTKIYQMGSEKVHALDHVTLDIMRGEMVCLLGPSGSGKSTLLNSLAGLERPTSGEIVIGGVHLETLNESQLTLFRSLNVGFVFQSYNLIPTLDALENVTFGLMLKGMPKKEYTEMAKEALSLVGLGERLHHRPNQLSGGQQQRVSIARALVGHPKILFADEPTGNLDTKTSYEVMDLISGVAEKENLTMIMVTHDEEMTEYADRLYHMRDGQIERISHQEVEHA